MPNDIQQGDIWWTYLPWRSMGRELWWYKHPARRPTRMVCQIAGERMRAIPRTLVAPFASNQTPDQPHALPCLASDAGRIASGSVRCQQLQGFPLFVDDDTSCDGGFLLKAGVSPFFNYVDTLQYAFAKLSDEIINVLSVESHTHLDCKPGQIISVFFEAVDTTPCVVLNAYEDSHLVHVLQTIGHYDPIYSQAQDIIFEIEETETTLETPLAVGLPLLRTIDYQARVDPENPIIGELPPDRFTELLYRLDKLIGLQ